MQWTPRNLKGGKIDCWNWSRFTLTANSLNKTPALGKSIVTVKSLEMNGHVFMKMRGRVIASTQSRISTTTTTATTRTVSDPKHGCSKTAIVHNFHETATIGDCEGRWESKRTASETREGSWQKRGNNKAFSASLSDSSWKPLSETRMESGLEPSWTPAFSFSQTTRETTSTLRTSDTTVRVKSEKLRQFLFVLLSFGTKYPIRERFRAIDFLADLGRCQFWLIPSQQPQMFWMIWMQPPPFTSR